MINYIYRHFYIFILPELLPHCISLSMCLLILTETLKHLKYEFKKIYYGNVNKKHKSK
jgi:hypothetical protein